MVSTDRVETTILYGLEQLGPCGFDELVRSLPDLSWDQVFEAVDLLSRSGSVTLRKRARFDYLISLRCQPTVPALVARPIEESAEKFDIAGP